MSDQEFHIEYTGNIQVHHPIKREAEVIQFPEPLWDQDLGYGRWNVA